MGRGHRGQSKSAGAIASCVGSVITGFAKAIFDEAGLDLRAKGYLRSPGDKLLGQDLGLSPCPLALSFHEQKQDPDDRRDI